MLSFLSSRNYRPTWKYNNTEPVTGNYYPVDSRIFIKVDWLYDDFTFVTHNVLWDLVYLSVGWGSWGSIHGHEWQSSGWVFPQRWTTGAHGRMPLSLFCLSLFFSSYTPLTPSFSSYFLSSLPFNILLLSTFLVKEKQTNTFSFSSFFFLLFLCNANLWFFSVYSPPQGPS